MENMNEIASTNDYIGKSDILSVKIMGQKNFDETESTNDRSCPAASSSKASEPERTMGEFAVANESCHKPVSCDAKIIKPRTLGECKNWPQYPCPIKGPAVVKVPVVLSEFTVQIDFESSIKLEEPALDIKRIKKNVFLTQCKLIPKTNKLFLRGFLRKNIEYSTVECADENGINGRIKHTTVKVPFECVTEVPFVVYPQFVKRFPQTEVEIFDPELLGKKSTEQDFQDFEFFNEEVRCELVFAKICEEDIERDQTKVNKNPDEHTFQTLTEKVVLYLKIKLLQDQQVFIPYCDKVELKDEMTVKDFNPFEDIE
ncbi:CsxC family protein [Fonticella tunisiensis]|uniref:DUF7852 domain-containing protein n=1 Tax=Fonticella tunisiensis TaxID=1096341 RepID=A0A4R7KQA0_9CLOT|nr:hypothetical protein [Fonticella tunisiensis]TDT61291.1 hypothetical protein EDD71_10716 [Fonticella tunisiensis]